MAGEATIGALKVDLTLDTAKFDSGIADVRTKTQKVMGDVGTVLGSALRGAAGEAASAIGVVGDVLMALGPMGIAAAAVIGGAFLGLKKSLDFGNQIADQAKQIGVSTDFLQELGYAAREVGGRTEDAANGLRNFSAVMGRAKQEGTQMYRLFKDGLGLDPKTWKNAEEGFKAVQGAVSNLKDESEKADIVKKLGMGELEGVLSMSKEAFEATTKAAHDTGSVLDKDLLENADRTVAMMDQLAYTIQVALAGAFLKVVPFVVGLVAELKDAWDWCAKLVTGVGHVIAEFGRWISKIGEVISNLAKLTGMKLDFGAMWKGISASDVGKFFFPGGAAVGVTAARGQQILDKANAKVGPRPKEERTGTVGQYAGRQGGGKKGGGGRDPAEAGEQAIAQATQAELQARAALTSNIQELADIRKQEIETQRAEKVRKLEEQAAEKKITAAAAQVAIGLENKAASQRQEALQRETTAKLADQELDQQEALLKLNTRQWNAQADMADTLGERQALEAAAFTKRQEAEAKRLASDTAAQVAKDATLAGWRQEQIDALKSAQLAEAAVFQHRQRVDALEESNRLTTDGIELQIDALQRQAELSTSAVERAKITESILELEKELERIKLEEIRDTTKSPAARAAAIARLAQLDKEFADKLKLARGTWLDAMRNMSGAILGAADAFKSGNWSGVVTALGGAFEQFMTALKTGANKLGAIGGIVGSLAQLAGSAIGGKAGGALSGAAGGAMAGAQFGPWGALAGGIIGGIGGLFGASKAKKAKKKAEAERKRQEEADRKAEEERKAAELAARKRELEIEIMRLTGDTVGALTAERADELKAMDESLRPMQERIWALEDAAEQEAQRASLLEQLADLTDQANGADREREKILAKLPAELRDLQRAVWNVKDAEEALEDAREEGARNIERARDQVIESYEREASALEEVRDRALQSAYSLQDFKRSLLLDNGLNNVNDNLATARDRFENMVKLAQGGNQRAFDLLPEVGKALLDASRGGAGSEQEFARDRARVLDMTRELEGRQLATASVADRQLIELKNQVAQFVQLNDSVMTVDQSLKNLTLVEQTAAAAEALAALRLEAAFTAAAQASQDALRAINDNIAQQAIDTAALAASVHTLATAPPPPAAVDAATALANLQPYLLTIAKNTGTSADLAQLDRDEADAA